jgi:hypothetical protein
MNPENCNIVYLWYCLRCQGYHHYPEGCPFDNIDEDEIEEYYYSMR